MESEESRLSLVRQPRSGATQAVIPILREKQLLWHLSSVMVRKAAELPLKRLRVCEWPLYGTNKIFSLYSFKCGSTPSLLPPSVLPRSVHFAYSPNTVATARWI